MSYADGKWICSPLKSHGIGSSPRRNSGVKFNLVRHAFRVYFGIAPIDDPAIRRRDGVPACVPRYLPASEVNVVTPSGRRIALPTRSSTPCNWAPETEWSLLGLVYRQRVQGEGH